MIKILDAFWRAFAYALTPRVLVLTLMPLVILVVTAGWTANPTE